MLSVLCIYAGLADAKGGGKKVTGKVSALFVFRDSIVDGLLNTAAFVKRVWPKDRSAVIDSKHFSSSIVRLSRGTYMIRLIPVELVPIEEIQ